jgi:HAD superfamily hydrolase (TIGR01509 family)
MNVIIPLGGKGDRFYKEGYTEPKPLIKILNKQMIFYVLDNLNIYKEDRIFIIYNTLLEQCNFIEIIKKKYPTIYFIPVYQQTSGAIETISIGLKIIMDVSNYKKCALLDCDTFYTYDILNIIRNSDKNLVFYTKTTSQLPIYSYIAFDTTTQIDKIIDIQEKKKISSNANTGCYVFNDLTIFNSYCQQILDNKITFNGEPYTSCVISEMIKKYDFYGYQLDSSSVFSLGTPRDVNKFISNSFVFLFDLDGTLVNTDDIYFDIWKQILYRYNIVLSFDIFKQYICGNDDASVIKKLLSNNGDTIQVKHISELKDRLFIENIHKIQIIDGMQSFIQLVKYHGHQCSIVSNCNRNVAEMIIKNCELTHLIDYIIIGNECKRPKPYADPYIEAMQKYNICPKKTIIFEDSKSGILSARLANPLCIVGITTNYSELELINNGANIIISNYNNVNLQKLISFTDMSEDKIKTCILNSLKMKITEITINSQKLKGGYISDVISLKIIANEELNCIIKLENKNENNLSVMANNLGLYERENYFYENISRYININVPKFHGLIKDDNLNTIGILMEDLNYLKYVLNLNLNKNDINISLKVIENMAKLHSKFWNKNMKKIFPLLKKHNDSLFNPFCSNYINNHWDCFKENWKNVLSTEQLNIAEIIKNNFHKVQERLSINNLTLIHGDVKSPNIFYDVNNQFEPYFLDWQYVANGKGSQDLIFFIIESFDIDNINLNYPIFKNYYYQKLIEFGVKYSYNDYENDLVDSVCYFPFFVAIWFGSLKMDELIDKNFPFFFIQKLFYFIEKWFSIHIL